MATANTVELWRECANWLTRCSVLRYDHRANWHDATISDLAHTLRDGVVLCNLLNKLEPGCIDLKDVNMKPQMAQFLCLRNIKVFLHTSHEIFGIKEQDLFDPSMLFDLTDFHKVLCMLAKLSKCPKIYRRNIEGFSAHRTESENDIYKELQSDDDNKTKEDPEDEYHYSEIPHEDIYEDLLNIKNARRTEVEHDAPSHNLEKRDYVIKELVDTETNYVEVLTKLQCYFLRPLSKCLNPADVLIIFKGIRELSEIHTGFLGQLRRACGGDCSMKLSEVFLNWRERFLIYGDYCANLTYAQHRLQELCDSNQMFNQEVVRCQQEANNGRFKLRDILSVPMQRILKYHLLLDKLIKETQHNHEDYFELTRAKEAMIDVAHYINEMKRDSDTLQLLHSLKENIVDWNVADGTELYHYGRLLRDGELKIKAHDDQKVKVRYVFIFDQVMLMCKSLKANQFSFRECLKLNEYKLEDATGRKILNKDVRWSYHWFLVRKTQRTAYTLYARTEDLKNKMIKALLEAMDNIEPTSCRKTDHRFVMHTFARPVSCVHCSKWLKGRLFQGYQCLVCYAAVHKSCIQNSGRCGHPTPAPAPSGTNASAMDASERALSDYLWFAGEMDREAAAHKLDKRIDGTYMLRIRPLGATNPNETPYALSLKTNHKVKHMKIYKKDVEGVAHYFLSESKLFKSIIELVGCYERTSLAENFVGLNVCLQWPYRRIKAIAECDFTPSDNSQLQLRRGCEIIVLSKDRDSQGWWRGICNNRIGFFPKSFVREEPELFTYDSE